MKLGRSDLLALLIFLTGVATFVGAPYVPALKDWLDRSGANTVVYWSTAAVVLLLLFVIVWRSRPDNGSRQSNTATERVGPLTARQMIVTRSRKYPKAPNLTTLQPSYFQVNGQFVRHEHRRLVRTIYCGNDLIAMDYSFDGAFSKWICPECGQEVLWGGEEDSFFQAIGRLANADLAKRGSDLQLSSERLYRV